MQDSQPQKGTGYNNYLLKTKWIIATYKKYNFKIVYIIYRRMLKLMKIFIRH